MPRPTSWTRSPTASRSARSPSTRRRPSWPRRPPTRRRSRRRSRPSPRPGTTATGDALDQALKLLKGDKSPAAIVLLSDGKSVRGEDVLTVARAAKAAKIPVYTVVARHRERHHHHQERAPARSRRTRPPCSRSPRSPAARPTRISDADELSQVYEQLGSKLTKKDKKQDVTNRVRRRRAARPPARLAGGRAADRPPRLAGPTAVSSASAQVPRRLASATGAWLCPCPPTASRSCRSPSAPPCWAGPPPA